MTTMQNIRVRNLAEMNLLPPLTKLQESLLKARVRILHADDVQEYQKRKLNSERLRLEADAHQPRLRWQAVARIVLLCLLFLGNGGLAVLFEMAGKWWWEWIPALAMLSGCVAIIQELNRADDTLARKMARVKLLEWRQYTIGSCGRSGFALLPDYEAPGVGSVTVLPRGAQEAARAIYETGAEAEFILDQLDSDPFLWVVSRDRPYERYCIFAWDEEGFIPQA